MIDVAARLQYLMNERNMNMYSLAKKSNVPWNTIKNIYSRGTMPNINTISMLCDGLGISLVQFFADSEDTIHLTSEQQYVIDRWNALSDNEKRVISDMMDALIKNKE